MRRRRPSDPITATEVSCWAYCPELWRLQYGLGLGPENRQALDAGNRHHARKAAAERLAAGSIAVGRFLAVLALLGTSHRIPENVR